MFRKKFYLISFLLVIGLLLTACTPTTEVTAPEEPPAEEPVTTAPTEVQICALLESLDVVWSASWYESYQKVSENPPLGLVMPEVKYTEALAGDEREAAMRDFAASGECDIVWAHGGHNDIVDNVKGDFPDVMFIEVGSGVIEMGGNNYHFWHRCHEPGYLLGVLAGHTSETGVVGAVAAFPAAEVNDILNAYIAGAKSVNPNIQVKIAFINSWWDPMKAGEEANAQIAAGADLIYMMCGNFDPCVENDIFCYARYQDYSQYYPDHVLASTVANWDEPIRWTIESWYDAVTGDGFNATESQTFSMSQGAACDMVLGSGLVDQIPQEVKEDVSAAREKILDGSLVIPINMEIPDSD